MLIDCKLAILQIKILKFPRHAEGPMTRPLHEGNASDKMGKYLIHATSTTPHPKASQ